MNYHNLLTLFKVIAANLGFSRGRCRHFPTCSLYSKHAFRRHGFVLGAWLTGKRLLKCHPWSRGGYDPVP